MSYTPCSGGSAAEGCPALVDDSATCINGTVCLADELYTEPNPYHIPGSCALAAPLTLDDAAIAALCATAGNVPLTVTKTEEIDRGGDGQVYPGTTPVATNFVTNNFATTTGDVDGICYILFDINYEDNQQLGAIKVSDIVPSWAGAGVPSLICRQRFYNFDQTDPVDPRQNGIHDLWFIPVGPTGTAAGNLDVTFPGNGTQIYTYGVHEICGLDPKNPIKQHAACLGPIHASDGTSARRPCSLPNPSSGGPLLASYAAAHVPGSTGDGATGQFFVWGPDKDEFGIGHTQGQDFSCNADIHVAWYTDPTRDTVLFQNNFENTDGGVNYAPSMMVMELCPAQTPGTPQEIATCELELTNPANHCHDTFLQWDAKAEICMAIAPGNDWTVELSTGAKYRIDNRAGSSLRCECINLTDFGCDATAMAPGTAANADLGISFTCSSYVSDPANGIVIESAGTCGELSHL